MLLKSSLAWDDPDYTVSVDMKRLFVFSGYLLLCFLLERRKLLVLSGDTGNNSVDLYRIPHKVLLYVIKGIVL